jgi:hypothetical protein
MGVGTGTGTGAGVGTGCDWPRPCTCSSLAGEEASNWMPAALLASVSVTCWGVAWGLVCKNRAAAPATYGEAMLVPESVAVETSEETPALRIAAPADGGDKKRQCWMV